MNAAPYNPHNVDSWRAGHVDRPTAEEAVTALLALCGAYDAKPPAWRFIPTHLIREVITGERGAVEQGSEGYVRRIDAVTAAERHHPKVVEQ